MSNIIEVLMFSCASYPCDLLATEEYVQIFINILAGRLEIFFSCSDLVSSDKNTPVLVPILVFETSSIIFQTVIYAN